MSSNRRRTRPALARATLYEHEYILVCTAANVAAANALAAAWDPDTGGDRTFGQDLGLSASGKAPATHYMVQSRAMPAMKTKMLAGHTGGKIIAYDCATWDQEAVLAALGLKRIESAT